MSINFDYYEELVELQNNALEETLTSMMKHRGKHKMPISKHSDLRCFKSSVDLEYKLAIKNLVWSLNEEVEDLGNNLIAGNMEGIRGNTEALKCMISALRDIVPVV